MCAQTVRRRLVPAVLAILWLALGSVPLFALGLKGRSQIVEDLYDTQFIDANEGWAVGVFGAVYHTTDGGKHWQLQSTPSTQHLYGVSFTDVKNGWAVGRSGEVLATSDGGAS